MERGTPPVRCYAMILLMSAVSISLQGDLNKMGKLPELPVAALDGSQI